MILYLTHFRWTEGDQKTYGILSDVPISQIQNAGFLAQGTNAENDASALPYIWNFLTGQILSQAVSTLDVSRMTVVSELELDVGSISALYQYKATTTDNTVNNLLLSNPDGDLSNPDDYVIYNGMYHGKVQDLPAGMFEGATLVRFKDLEDVPEDAPSGVSLDMIALPASNEESTSSSAASLKVKDKNGNWVDISDVSVRTHGGSAQPSNPLLQMVPCYPSLDTYSGDDPYNIVPSLYDESTGEHTKGKLYTYVYVFLDENDMPMVIDTNDIGSIHTVLFIDCVGGQQSIYTKHSKDFIWPFLPSGTINFDMTGNIWSDNNSTYNVWDEETQQSITKPQYDFEHPVYARLIDLLLGGYYGG